jgi:hypothetical protein
VQEARRINAGHLVENMQGGVIRGHLGKVFTREDIESINKSGADIDPELLWCRAAAAQIKLNVTYMDWYWYQCKSDEEIDAYLLEVQKAVEEKAIKKKKRK